MLLENIIRTTYNIKKRNIKRVYAFEILLIELCYPKCNSSLVFNKSTVAIYLGNTPNVWQNLIILINWDDPYWTPDGRFLVFKYMDMVEKKLLITYFYLRKFASVVFCESATKCEKWQLLIYLYIKCTRILRWPLKEPCVRFNWNFANILDLVCISYYLRKILFPL